MNKLSHVLLFRTILFFLQFFSLYILPLICIAAGYVFFSLLGFMIKRPHGAAIILNPYHAANNLSSDC